MGKYTCIFFKFFFNYSSNLNSVDLLRWFTDAGRGINGKEKPSESKSLGSRLKLIDLRWLLQVCHVDDLLDTRNKFFNLIDRK